MALTETKGSVSAMETASQNYSKEIQRLINSGLSPESDAVQRLRNEQQQLNQKIKESNDVTKMQADLTKLAEKATVAMYAALAAGVAAIGAMTQKTAEMGDQFAKASRTVGMTAETFQELNYAAKLNNISDITPHLQKLQKSMIDLSNGTGQLTKYVNENDKQLGEQLKNVKSNEDAFMLLMDAINKAPNEFAKAEIATAAFGKAGLDMINMANDGVDGIAELREEARKYGIISNDAADASEKYIDAQTRLKSALTGVQTELTSKLLPNITTITNKVAEFIASFDDWERVITTAGYVLAGLTAGLTAFLIISKGAAAIETMATAFKALNAAIVANPIGAIAVVVTAVLIPALIYLIKNWDTVQTYLSQGVARLEYAFKWFGSVIKEKLLVAFAAIKAAGATLIDFIYGNIIRAVGSMLEVMGKLPFVGDMFNSAAQTVNRLGQAMGNIAAESRRAVAETIDAAAAEQRETQATLDAKLKATDDAARARRAELEVNKRTNEEQAEADRKAADDEIALMQEMETAKTENAKNSANDRKKTELEILKDKLNEIDLTEQQAQNEKITAVEQFLMKRAQLETDDYEARIAYIKDMQAQMLANEQYVADEKVAIENACNNALIKLKEQQEQSERELLQNRLQAYSQFFNGYSQLLNVLGEKNRLFAIAGKILASAEAGINTALAATKALASGPFPFNIAMMTSTIAAGVAQQIKIATTSIPSAETGGRFIVPNSTGVDSGLLRVNQGEVAEITPRGVNKKESFNFKFMFGQTEFASIINKLARSGELYSLSLASNL